VVIYDRRTRFKGVFLSIFLAVPEREDVEIRSDTFDETCTCVMKCELQCSSNSIGHIRQSALCFARSNAIPSVSAVSEAKSREGFCEIEDNVSGIQDILV
jgi:hypothetical protein